MSELSMTSDAPPIVLPANRNLRLVVVEEHRTDRIAYEQLAEREAGSAEHLPSEWRDWRAANPGPTLKQRWIDRAHVPQGPDDEGQDMRNPLRHFRCESVLWQRFKRTARRRGDSMGEVLRRAIVAYLAQHETEEDRAAAREESAA
jgi:hypothetical protein